MDDEYDITDLRQYINGRPVLINPPPPNYYDMLILPSDCAHNSTSLAAAAASNATSGGLIGLEHQNNTGGSGGMISGDYNTNNNGRWPRQETLTLLEVRSRLDYKFKEANLKGPLWDEVSRIMSEEYGYQRSGKKCREKFENLYKYYKKTKDQGKGTSRQDHGKRYRFFRQLEAIYGESSSNNNPASISEAHLNIGGNFQHNYANYNNNAAPSSANNNNASTSSGYNDTTSSDHHHIMDDGFPKRGAVEKRIWKAKVEELISEQMTRLIEKQEDWMEKMMITIENREKERTMREEQWRRDNMERIEREHKYWAGERAWIEARDDALVNAFERFTGKELKLPHKEQMCLRIDESGTNMKRKEVNVSRSSCFLDPNHVGAITKQGGEVGSCDMNINQQGGVGHTISLNIDGNNSSLSANNDAVNDGSFRFFTWDGYGRYMN